MFSGLSTALGFGDSEYPGVVDLTPMDGAVVLVVEEVEGPGYPGVVILGPGKPGVYLIQIDSA